MTDPLRAGGGLRPATAERTETPIRRSRPPARGQHFSAGREDQFAEDLSRRFPGFTPEEGWAEAAAVYPPLTSPYYLSLVRNPDCRDPVFCQVAPSAAELDDGDDDPVGEAQWSPAPGLIRRYPDRALVMPTSRCFVRCRHCMRKRSWGAPDADDAAMAAWREWLRKNPEVHEVIISGGDPLTLSDTRLERLLDLLLSAGTLREVRVHSRAVAAAPVRITPRLAALLAAKKVRRLVTQLNLAAEITELSAAAARTLMSAGIAVENQAVLLHGVNDRAETLAGLFQGLNRAGIRPYYLHHPDPVRGAMHFTLGMDEGWRIYDEARRLAGVPAPEYVVDRPGSSGKERVEDLLKG